MPFGIFPPASLDMTSSIYDARFSNCHCRLLRHIHHFRGGIGYQPVFFLSPTFKANKPLHNLGYCGTKVALICGGNKKFPKCPILKNTFLCIYGV